MFAIYRAPMRGVLLIHSSNNKRPRRFIRNRRWGELSTRTDSFPDRAFHSKTGARSDKQGRVHILSASEERESVRARASGRQENNSRIRLNLTEKISESGMT
ncbi:hypothetical protein NDU88_002126 [Pleurodeles waltl]|uniref:Uncharacterized protein n=1 Tax=Pleurodeles waltl TaxID=8319 RepID=A0AAV7R941_PLEWA|nr:hypothetical protein NDU88_002126 [Pleurodeles waltl]